MPNPGGDRASLPPGRSRSFDRAGLDHDGQRLESAEGALSAGTAFLRAGLDAGEPSLCLAPGARLRALRDLLADESAGISWVDTEILGRNPARLMPLLREFVHSHPGARVRVFGNISYSPLPPPMRDELFLHELLLAAPECQSWPMRLQCCYEPAEIGAETADLLEDLHRHPATDNQIRAAFAAELPEPPPSVRRLRADITTLATLRRFVHDRADLAGVERHRIDDLVYAVNEAVTNSICHGAGHAELSAWTEDEWFCCEVRDRGRIPDPMAGRIPPQAGDSSGRGLWLIHHLCDLVQVRSSGAGTAVRMRIDRRPSG